VSDIFLRFGYPGVFLLVGLESLGIPLPGETTLIAASIYSGVTHKLAIGWIIGVAALGAIIGDNIGYALGHWGGYRLVVRYGKYIRFDQSRVKLARYIFLRHGAKVVFFGRFVSILRTYAAFLAGTTRMPWQRFLVFNAAGGIVWSTVWGTLGYMLGSQVTRVNTPLAIGFGVVGAVAVVAGAVALRRQESRLAVIAERALPGPLEGYPGGKPL